MFATTTTATFTNSSDANFRIWGLAFATKLLEAGLVQTQDTGQINWTTVTAPAAINTFQGYEIWRFNDTLQASAPVFIKLEYGSATGSANNPAIRFQIGSGSNGTGTLTGSLSTQLTAMGTALAVTTTHYWSGGNARFVGFMGGGGVGATTNTPMLLAFERSKDANGNDTSEAVLVIYKATAAGATPATFAQFAWDTATGMKTVAETTAGLSILLPTQGTGITGTQVATYPVLHTKGVFMNPGMNIQGYYNDDLTSLSIVAVPFYGTNRNFLCLGTAITTTVVTRRTSGEDACLMMRYE